MKKSQESKIIKYLLITAIIFFVVWGIITIVTKNIEFIFDRFFTAAICLLGFFLYKKMHLRLPSVLFGLLTLILHHLKLYGNVYYGVIQFDMIMHFAAGMALAFIFYNYLSYNNPKIWSAIFAFFIVSGICSINEILEYAGYYFLGPGEGLLFYGTGDFGEYADTAWDLICNSTGAFVGILLMIIFSEKSKK